MNDRNGVEMRISVFGEIRAEADWRVLAKQVIDLAAWKRPLRPTSRHFLRFLLEPLFAHFPLFGGQVKHNTCVPSVREARSCCRNFFGCDRVLWAFHFSSTLDQARCEEGV
ncbi:hypothetical protein [Novosphingobium sp.]|uniref:hypothetical protein n=1 Tax=Novosphingobium sp. TaxID=1874826 RepID=UPI002612A57F|nr:hypothetical protein [Novosphingobium sp.]